MQLLTIPRAVVKTGLRGIRIPVSLAERVTGPTPYEGIEASAKLFFGTLLRDDELCREGQTQRAKLAELAEAERLRLKAEQKRREADARLDNRLGNAEELRDDVEQRAEAKKREAAQAKAAQERKVAEQTRQREQQAAQAEAERNKVVNAAERRARRTRVDAESAALADKSQALAAAERAEQIEGALEAKKAERKRA